MERVNKMDTAILDTAELRKDVAPIVSQANALTVTNPEEAQIAFDLRKAAKSFVSRVEAFFEPHKKRAKAAHAGLCDDEKKELAPATAAITIIDVKLSLYQDVQRLKQEKERQELAAKARKDAEDKALADAQAAHDAGEKDEAEAILAAPVSIPAVAAPKSVKLEGGSFRTEYYGVVTDKAAFIRAASENAGLHGLLEVPQGALNKFAASTKGAMQIPGLRFGSKQVPVGR